LTLTISASIRHFNFIVPILDPIERAPNYLIIYISPHNLLLAQLLQTQFFTYLFYLFIIMSDNEQENHSKETQVISPSADSSKKRKLDQDEEDEQSPEEDTVIKTTNALVTDPGAFAIDDQGKNSA